MKIFYSEKCLEYGSYAHPESPERVLYSAKFLKERGFEFVEPKPCSEEDLLLTHSKEYVEKIKNGDFSDPDTPNYPRIFDLARLSAGSAIQAMNLALKKENAFSLMRPPGHHAGINGKALGATSLGFCYFNNIAIAVKKALKKVKRVVIIDIDCHHGNGTQEIFIGDKNVLYISLHKFPLYPGTGKKTEKNCLNFPLGFETTRDEYLETFEKAVVKARDFSPDLVAVSAGFDTYKKDPLTGGLGLDKKSFFAIGKIIKKLEKPVFCVLEGGYSKDLPECIYEFLVGLE